MSLHARSSGQSLALPPSILFSPSRFPSYTDIAMLDCLQLFTNHSPTLYTCMCWYMYVVISVNVSRPWPVICTSSSTAVVWMRSRSILVSTSRSTWIALTPSWQTAPQHEIQTLQPWDGYVLRLLPSLSPSSPPPFLPHAGLSCVSDARDSRGLVRPRGNRNGVWNFWGTPIAYISALEGYANYPTPRAVNWANSSHDRNNFNPLWPN